MKEITIKIKECPDCPYLDDGYWCEKHEKAVNSENPIPPDWCTLPDAKEE